ncbi:MAG: 2-oxo-4-hydroxy-4-carboxy-5-ureidoimidazoline decarboxylase [Emcibacter sp.]|nr:2-oxo-4-hydroxy-4-carboxy-5-ureidoimidazoline decarboxylase [Emcibacter sp.]
MDREKFIDIYGGIYEHSPWVAEKVWQLEDRADLAVLMKAVVEASGREDKLALLRAHPTLAGRAAISGELSRESAREQRGAGLNQCSPEEFQELQDLNAAYSKKFGFPFIIAVGGLNRFDILKNFRMRIKNTAEDEFATALKEVHKIARLRLAALSKE